MTFFNNMEIFLVSSVKSSVSCHDLPIIILFYAIRNCFFFCNIMFRVNKRLKQKFLGYLCKVKLKCNGSLIPSKIDLSAQSQNEKKILVVIILLC